MHNQNKKYWVWLSILTNVVEIKTIHKLLNKYKEPEYIWNLSKKELKRCKIQMKEINNILSIKYRQELENYMFYMKKVHIIIISYNDNEYPALLKNIVNPPVVLYARGNVDLLNKVSVGIVGCRRCSYYGKEIARKMAFELSKKDITVVSGLARGIDTWSHIGALNGKGNTIAVLGSGLDNIYPPENKGVYQKIIETGGLVISEYIVGIKPLAHHFPNRNRIISGLSKGVLLVEARKRSGSFITVDYALEQGRDVYAIPSDITRTEYVGANELIKQGAKLVTNVSDIIEDLN